MLIGHIFSVLRDAFLYPFIHLKDISVVFFKSLVIYVVLGYIAIWVTTYGLGHEELTKSLVYIVDAVLALAVFLALMPLYVSVTRHAVMGEAVDRHVVRRILKTREVMTFVSWVKWLFLLLIPIFLAGLPMVFGIIETTGGFLPGLGLGTDITVAHVVLLLGFLIGMYLAIRGSMMVINAPLDRDMTMKKSFSMTHGHVLLIVGFLIGYLIVTLLVTKILLWLYVMFGGSAELESLRSLPIWGTMIVTIIYTFYDLLMGIIFVVGLSKIHLIIDVEK